MSEFIAELSPFFQWLLKSTTQASVLICVILFVQILFGKKLGLRWYYCLWMLLIVRMLMPWSPQSKVSVYNFVPAAGQVKATFEHISQKPFLINNNITGEPMATPLAIGDQPTKPVHRSEAPAESNPAASAQSTSVLPSSWPSVDTGFVLGFVWVAGAGLLTCVVFAGNFRLWQIIKSKRPVTDQKVLDMLEDCKSQMGIETILAIVETKKVQSPALFGFMRPRLLLPAGMLKSLTAEELEHIFLHELAHLKRFDIYLGWVMAVLQILHWFNPMVWFAFYRIRADRELACDGLALSTMGTDQPDLYGQTIVSLLERFSCHSRLPSMAGILEDKSQIKRRISSIARFKKSSYKWTPLAIMVLVIIGFVTLSDAHNTKGDEPSFLIKGVVTDAVTGKPIAGVRVGDDGYADGRQWTITDSQGRYSYPTWYEEHNIKAEADGYSSSRETLLTKIFGSEKEKTIDFELGPGAVSLPYKASLPDGVSVELVGLAAHPSKGKNWWSPDGTELAGNPWDGINSRISISPMPGRKAYELAVLIKYEEGNEPGNYVYSEHSKNAAHSNVNKSSTSNMSCSVLDMPGDKEVTDIKLGIASGKYETRYSREMPLHGTYVRRPDKKGKGISWFAPIAVDDKTSITITHGYNGEQSKLIAVDSDGKEHVGSGNGGSFSREAYTMQYKFNVPIDRIKEFVFQSRPYKLYEFKNVALRPGAVDVADLLEEKMQEYASKIEPLPMGTPEEQAEWMRQTLLMYAEPFRAMLTSESAEKEFNDAIKEAMEEIDKEMAEIAEQTSAFIKQPLVDQADEFFVVLNKAYEAKNWKVVEESAKALRDFFRDKEKTAGQEIRASVETLAELSDEVNDAIRDGQMYLVPAYYNQLIKEWERFKSGDSQARSEVQVYTGVGVIEVEDDVHDFGTIGPNSKNESEFKFKNVGTGVLKITKVKAACGCTVPELDKNEYAPGESGTIKVTYRSSKRDGPVKKHLYIESDDPKNPKFELTIKANVEVKVAVRPTTLLLALTDQQVKPIELVSKDGVRFSIDDITFAGNAITFDIDPAKESTRFVLTPKIDLDKLRETERGTIVFKLTHPECDEVTVKVNTIPEFELSRPRIILQNVVAGQKATKDIWITSNYGEKVEIESVSFEKDLVEIMSREHNGNDLKIVVQITVPEKQGKSRYFSDTINIKLKSGQQFKVRCTGFLADLYGKK